MNELQQLKQSRNPHPSMHQAHIQECRPVFSLQNHNPYLTVKSYLFSLHTIPAQVEHFSVKNGD